MLRERNALLERRSIRAAAPRRGQLISRLERPDSVRRSVSDPSGSAYALKLKAGHGARTRGRDFTCETCTEARWLASWGSARSTHA